MLLGLDHETSNALELELSARGEGAINLLVARPGIERGPYISEGRACCEALKSRQGCRRLRLRFDCGFS
jgi:hypothetical protein